MFLKFQVEVFIHVIVYRGSMNCINSLWPSDATWRHGSLSTSSQVMAWHLIQYYLFVNWIFEEKNLQCHSNQDPSILFKNIHLKLSSASCYPSC